MKKYDEIIIGFGKGGKTLAATLGGQGKKVALIEKSKAMYGGTCINVGCIPTKSLVHSMEMAKGIADADKAKAYQDAVLEKRRLTTMLNQKNYDKLATMDTVDVIDGTASFLDPHRIKIETENGMEEIEGDRIFINTGSKSFIPPISGVKENPFVYTSESLMELEVLPKHLAIIGGGYIGLEYASIYRGFGSEVSVLQIEDEFVPKEDRDIADAMQEAFEKRGVKIYMDVKTEEICSDGEKATIRYTKDETSHEITADAVLLATGRVPNTETLNLEAAGVEVTSKGAVKVDDKLRTTVPHIWAMGDVVGGLQFTYISLDDFRIVKDQLVGKGERTTEDRNVPYSVFIDPPYSRVGMSEKEARDKGLDIKIAKLPAAAIPKAQVLKNPVGLLKSVIDAKTDKILGAMLFCEESYETINIIKLAMDAGLPYTVLRDFIYTHPTMSEGLNDLYAL